MNKKLTFKRMVSSFLLLGAFLSCKKDQLQPSRDLSIGEPEPQAATVLFPSTRNILFLLNEEKTANPYPNKYLYEISSVNSLESNPYKLSLFKAEPGFKIAGICRGTTVNKIYFLYRNVINIGDKKNGLWSISTTGTKPTQILSQSFIGNEANIEVDEIAHSIYWIESENPDNPEFGAGKLMRCDEIDGGNLTEIKIEGVKNVGRFTIDEKAKKIYFVYFNTNANAYTLGCADFNGKMITPVIAKFEGIFAVDKLSLDLPNNRIYTSYSGYILFTNINGQNQVPTELAYAPISNLGWTAVYFDFKASKTYFAAYKDMNFSGFSTIRFGNINMNNDDKYILGNSNEFRTVRGMAGIFGWNSY